MIRFSSTPGRGSDDGATSVRIRYQDPPPRSPEDITTLLAIGRNLGDYEPRLTPPDACAAQDRALDKDGILKLSFRTAATSRRDSGVNSDAIDASSAAKDYATNAQPQAAELKPRFQQNFTKPPMSRENSRQSANGTNRPRIRIPAGLHAYFSSPTPSTEKVPLKATHLSIHQPTPTRDRSTSPKRKLSEISTSVEDTKSEDRQPPTKLKQMPKKTTPRPDTPSRQHTPRAPSTAQSSPKRPSRLRKLSHEDLAINGTPMLNPHSIEVKHEVRQYLHKGKWYEVIGEEGRPDWAEDEKVVIKTTTERKPRRSTGNWRNNSK